MQEDAPPENESHGIIMICERAEGCILPAGHEGNCYVRTRKARKGEVCSACSHPLALHFKDVTDVVRCVCVVDARRSANERCPCTDLETPSALASDSLRRRLGTVPTCTYRFGRGGEWVTACGVAFDVPTSYIVDLFKWCPSCGKPVEVLE